MASNPSPLGAQSFLGTGQKAENPGFAQTEDWSWETKKPTDLLVILVLQRKLGT